MGRLAGKVAIITGSASGIGRGTALRFAAEGAIVVGGDLNADGGETVAAQCREKGVDAFFLKTDVTSEADIAALAAATIEKFGKADILFNNAGFGGAIGPIEDTPIENWDLTQNVLLRSAFLGMKHIAPHMKKVQAGSIISTSSIAGLRGYPYLHAYCAAKAGLINLTRSAAIEFGQYGIRVNCICPGDIITPMRSSKLEGEEQERELASHQPIPRAGQVDDIANAALYFASDESRWVTGTDIPIDGGQVSGIWTYGQNADLKHVRQSGFLGPSFLRDKNANAAKPQT